VIGGRDQRSLAREGWLYVDICVGVPEFLVTPLLMGQFEKPVRIMKTKN